MPCTVKGSVCNYLYQQLLSVLFPGRLCFAQGFNKYSIRENRFTRSSSSGIVASLQVIYSIICFNANYRVYTGERVKLLMCTDTDAEQTKAIYNANDIT